MVISENRTPGEISLSLLFCHNNNRLPSVWMSGMHQQSSCYVVFFSNFQHCLYVTHPDSFNMINMLNDYNDTFGIMFHNCETVDKLNC